MKRKTRQQSYAVLHHQAKLMIHYAQESILNEPDLEGLNYKMKLQMLYTKSCQSRK